MEKVKKKSRLVLTRFVDNGILKSQKGGNTLDKEQIAKKLINLRDGKSRNEVAKAVGISVSALSMYENGDRIPRDEIKVKIAEYYGESIESIFF